MSGNPPCVDAPVTASTLAWRWRLDRSKLVLLHRYVGLVIAGFLLMAGVTGILLAWNHELYALPDPSTGAVPELANDEFFVDPYSG